MTLATGDLTTLANARAYLDNPPSDQVLGGLVTRVSRWIQAELNRGLLVPKFYRDQRDGTGTAQILLPRWPLLGIPTVVVSGVVIPLAPQVSSTVPSLGYPCGFRVPTWDGIPPGDPPVIELIGYRFTYGRQNVVISYSAGYQVTNEAQTIPGSPYQVVPLAPYGIWATDQGVTNATTGVAFTAVTGAPGPGQYNPPKPEAGTPISYYLFNAADTGTPLLLNYGYIPGELEQAAIELVAERAAYRSRVGIRSQMLASQESMSFDNSGLPKYVVDMIYPYISVLPPATGASV